MRRHAQRAVLASRSRWFLPVGSWEAAAQLVRRVRAWYLLGARPAPSPCAPVPADGLRCASAFNRATRAGRGACLRSQAGEPAASLATSPSVLRRRDRLRPPLPTGSRSLSMCSPLRRRQQPVLAHSCCELLARQTALRLPGQRLFASDESFLNPREVWRASARRSAPRRFRKRPSDINDSRPFERSRRLRAPSSRKFRLTRGFCPTRDRSGSRVR